MVKLSRFTHSLDLGDHIALWHSLRLRPVFITHEMYEDLISGKDIPVELFNELRCCCVAVENDTEDDEVFGLIRSKVPKPGISLGYFILSERCNLSCKYCFVGENSARRELLSHKDMTKETAEKAILFYQAT